MLFNRKAVSPLVANALLILLVIVMVSAIALALVPVIKKSLSGFENCIEAQNSLDFIQTRVSCYDGSESLAGMTIKLNNAGVKKFRLSLTDSQGDSIFYDISEGPNPLGFGMFGLGQPYSAGITTVNFPEEGQQLSYIASGVDIVGAEISPIVKKEICPISDVIELNSCPSSINLATPVSIFVSFCVPGGTPPCT